MATVTITYRFNGIERDVDMPGATTCLYAAKRMAEQLGLDPSEREWCLVDPRSGMTLPQGDVIASWDGRMLGLGYC